VLKNKRCFAPCVISGITAAAVYIPQFQIRIKKRISDHVSVFAAELVAMMIALQWVEEVKPRLVVTYMF